MISNQNPNDNNECEGCGEKCYNASGFCEDCKTPDYEYNF